MTRIEKQLINIINHLMNKLEADSVTITLKEQLKEERQPRKYVNIKQLSNSDVIIYRTKD